MIRDHKLIPKAIVAYKRESTVTAQRDIGRITTMKREDLLELIENGENSGVEFKRDDIRENSSHARRDRRPSIANEEFLNP